MKSHIKPDEHPGRSLEKILRRVSKRAVRDIREIDDNTVRRVHRLRTDMKKLRSAVRLAKSRAPSAQFDPVCDGAKTLKNVFARARDAAVQKHIDASLVGKKGTARRSPGPSKEEKRLARAAAKALSEAVDRLDLSDVAADDFKRALEQTFQLSNLAMIVAQANAGDTHAFHNWRKRVKDLWYQSALLRELHPQAILWSRVACTLSSILGKGHDLGIAAQRQSCLETKALVDGKLLRVRAQAFELGITLHPVAIPAPCAK